MQLEKIMHVCEANQLGEQLDAIYQRFYAFA